MKNILRITLASTVFLFASQNPRAMKNNNPSREEDFSKKYKVEIENGQKITRSQNLDGFQDDCIQCYDLYCDIEIDGVKERFFFDIHHGKNCAPFFQNQEEFFFLQNCRQIFTEKYNFIKKYTIENGLKDSLCRQRIPLNYRHPCSYMKPDCYASVLLSNEVKK